MSEMYVLRSVELAKLFVLAVLLSGCSVSFDYVSKDSNPPPDADQSKAVREQILQQTKAMKFSTSEVSPIGPNAAQSGTEDWTVCVRDKPPGGVLRYYMFFVRAGKVVDGRTPVINDGCENREYQPL